MELEGYLMSHSVTVHKLFTRTQHRVDIVWLDIARDLVTRKRGNAFKSFEKNPKWTARDPVAQKRGNAFKSLGKNTKWPARDPVARKRGNAFKSLVKNTK